MGSQGSKCSTSDTYNASGNGRIDATEIWDEPTNKVSVPVKPAVAVGPGSKAEVSAIKAQKENESAIHE